MSYSKWYHYMGGNKMSYSKWYHYMIEKIRNADDTYEVAHYYRRVNREMALCGFISVEFRNFLTRQIAYERAKKGEFYGCGYLSKTQEDVMKRMSRMNKHSDKSHQEP